jgi:hypothetical protein
MLESENLHIKLFECGELFKDFPYRTMSMFRHGHELTILVDDDKLKHIFELVLCGEGLAIVVYYHRDKLSVVKGNSRIEFSTDNVCRLRDDLPQFIIKTDGLNLTSHLYEGHTLNYDKSINKFIEDASIFADSCCLGFGVIKILVGGLLVTITLYNIVISYGLINLSIKVRKPLIDVIDETIMEGVFDYLFPQSYIREQKLRKLTQDD